MAKELKHLTKRSDDYSQWYNDSFGDDSDYNDEDGKYEVLKKQRLEIVFGIRPKLKLMNQKLKRLIRAVKYTRLSDVWAEIDYGARSEVDKPTIVQRCKERWRRNARQ